MNFKLSCGVVLNKKKQKRKDSWLGVVRTLSLVRSLHLPVRADLRPGQCILKVLSYRTDKTATKEINKRKMKSKRKEESKRIEKSKRKVKEKERRKMDEWHRLWNKSLEGIR